jgi:hypothetical protein
LELPSLLLCGCTVDWGLFCFPFFYFAAFRSDFACGTGLGFALLRFLLLCVAALRPLPQCDSL